MAAYVVVTRKYVCVTERFIDNLYIATEFNDLVIVA